MKSPTIYFLLDTIDEKNLYGLAVSYIYLIFSKMQNKLIQMI